MTLKDIIKSELLATVEDPSELDSVYERHGKSKGSFYGALSEATAELLERTEHAIVETGVLEERRDEVQSEVHDLEARAQELRTTVDSLVDRLDESRALVERAEDLQRRGFRVDDLDRLAGILAHVAASAGAPPEEGIAEFFATVARYESVVSFNLEAKMAEAKVGQARAEVDRWQAEARSAEAASKARRQTITIVDRLLGQGVKEADLVQWERILTGINKTPGQLSKLLKRYGSLGALIKERMEEGEQLRRSVEQLQAQVTALNRERDRAAAAIREVRDSAVGQVSALGREATTVLRRLLGTLENSVAEAYQLGYSNAEERFRVDYPCVVCSEPVPILSWEAKQAAARFMHEGTWAHKGCVDGDMK